MFTIVQRLRCRTEEQIKPTRSPTCRADCNDLELPPNHHPAIHHEPKKKRHTLKVQVVVDEETGRFVEVSDSFPGPTADMSVLKSSGVVDRLPPGVGLIGDLAYVGMDKLRPGVGASAPRRKPRSKPRPEEDVGYNREFSRRRVVVEHSIGRMRRFKAVTEVDRHHQRHHAARVKAVAGLVNRQLRYGAAC